MHEFYHALNSVSGMSYMALTKLWRQFRSWRYAFHNPSFESYVRAGLTENLSLKIIETRKIFDIEREFKRLQQSGICLVLQDDVEFPELLKNIPWPPFGLYRKGASLTCLQKKIEQHVPTYIKLATAKFKDNKIVMPFQVREEFLPMKKDAPTRTVAIVGTRIPSSYGVGMAFEIAEKISLCGGIVISGLAFGVDAAAHRGAIKNSKPTIAVLASGLDTITPSSHLNLAQSIVAAGGTLISEYASGSVSYKGNFLARNRLISGLSLATIIIEAKEKSGALITARHALEQGRDTYALVGDITRPQARGCLNLLMEGSAQPIFSIAELMEQLGLDINHAVLQQLNQDEMLVFSLIKNCSLEEERTLATEELAIKSGLEIWTIAGILTQLEMKKLIRKNTNGQWEFNANL